MPSTSGLVPKNQVDSENKNLEKETEDVEKKIPNRSTLDKKTDLNTKITEIENRISDNTNLATKADLNAKVTDIENKIPDTSHFNDTQEFKRLTKVNIDARMKKEVKTLARKTKAENALDLRDQNRQKKKTSRRLIQIILMVKVILDMMELKVIWYISF